jgi:GNAT superfamily N-acetyltransferase
LVPVPQLSQGRLRPATAADIEIILRHRREMFREMGGKYQQFLGQFESASRRYYEIALRAGTYYGVFAEIDSEIAAGGGILIADWPGSPLNFEPKRAWILNIYVEPQHRRKGLAKTITERLIEWCRHEGFQAVQLHASEYGRGLYQKLGFRGTNEMRLLL